jgi:hypothetical protein
MRPGTTKAPPCGAFAQCAEEDSNLHPAIPDQALNLVAGVSYPSRSRQIVRCRPETRMMRTHRTIWMLPRMLPRGAGSES